MFLDPNHPMFKPVWVRWVCVIIPVFWSVVEFWYQTPLWGILFAGLAAYAFYILIWIGPSSE